MLERIITSIRHWWQVQRWYVTMDAADNSVTLGRHLLRHMASHSQDSTRAQVFVFKTSLGTYGFAVNPHIEQPTQLCDIQVNDEHHCVGFETLCPSVGRIFYDYGVPASAICRLSVRYINHKTQPFYEIMPPKCRA